MLQPALQPRDCCQATEVSVKEQKNPLSVVETNPYPSGETKTTEKGSTIASLKPAGTIRYLLCPWEFAIQEPSAERRRGKRLQCKSQSLFFTQCLQKMD